MHTMTQKKNNEIEMSTRKWGRKYKLQLLRVKKKKYVANEQVIINNDTRQDQ
jgi:hypothetical protein